MEHSLREEICRFVLEESDNRFPGSSVRYFDDPLIGFAAATDSLFTEYKSVIGEFHLTPGEIVAASTPEDPWTPATVISWVLPISVRTRASNRDEAVYPSRAWAETRYFGEQFNSAGEMIGEFSLAITNGLGISAIGRTIHPYPTQAEAIKRLADVYNRTRLTPFVKKVLAGWLKWQRK